MTALTLPTTAETAADSDWSQRTLTDLHAYLVARFHVHARHELDALEALSAKVADDHGARHSEVFKVAQLVLALRDDMLPHMMKEEMVLFPYVEQLETADAPPQSCFGTIQNPIRVMLMEHESVGDLLRAFRTVTGDYALPDDACSSYRELYARLQEFERETHEHIHLENDIYFPRALQMEKSCNV